MSSNRPYRVRASFEVHGSTAEELAEAARRCCEAFFGERAFTYEIDASPNVVDGAGRVISFTAEVTALER